MYPLGRFKVVALLMISIFSLVLSGCGSHNTTSDASRHSSEETNSHPQHKDIQETTKSINELPSFLNKLDPQIGQVYQIAAQNEQLLNWIPCYCGCGEVAGHRSNRDCFIKEVKANGEIVWDSHGTGCGACLNIAFESALLKKQGKSDLEIRKYIDSQYSEGYSTPTPTPMPKI